MRIVNIKSMINSPKSFSCETVKFTDYRMSNLIENILNRNIHGSKGNYYGCFIFTRNKY